MTEKLLTLLNDVIEDIHDQIDEYEEQCEYPDDIHCGYLYRDFLNILIPYEKKLLKLREEFLKRGVDYK